MSVSGVVDRVWYGTDGPAWLARRLLAPAALAFRAVSEARNALYDAGWLTADALPLPALSVGNLSVGGTGKTPVAAHLAALLRRAGAQPAVLLRGYGDDEPLVHRVLNPGIPVHVDADRRRGAIRAVEAGADVLVMDDAFQHRRARRDIDVVLVDADRWHDDLRLLPAGPLREAPSALRRASHLVVTHKAAPTSRVDRVTAWLAVHAPAIPTATVHLAPSALAAWGSSERRSLSTLAGERVCAVAAIADPQAFAAQLRHFGASVALHARRDHHRYSQAEAEELGRLARTGVRIVCTLKDAVKLGPLWSTPDAALWYLTQDVILERGHEALTRSITALVRDPRR